MYTQEMIAQSDYEGWVAWVDGTPIINPATNGLIGWHGSTPIFEKVVHAPGRASIADGMVERATRTADRTTMDWKELPHEHVRELELYAFRDVRDVQPLVTLTANANRDVRWIQYKTGAVVVPAVTQIGRVLDRQTTAQRRVSIGAWRVGYWDRTVGQCEMIEFYADGRDPHRYNHSGSNHPCWPKPMGFALAPFVLGLADDDVPPLPAEFAAAGPVM